MVVLIAIVVIVALIVVWGIATYNRLITLRTRVKNAWAQIDVQLKRRADLIPNLVNTVKGYTSHERGTLEDVIRARQQVIVASSPNEVMAANNQLTGALRQLFAVAESYPDLKANENFLRLQADLTDTEDKISYMRQSYNDCVMIYNTAICVVPSVIIAKLFHFQEAALYEVVGEQREAPVVDFANLSTSSASPASAPQEAPAASTELEAPKTSPAPTPAVSTVQAAASAPTAQAVPSTEENAKVWPPRQEIGMPQQAPNQETSQPFAGQQVSSAPSAPTSDTHEDFPTK